MNRGTQESVRPCRDGGQKVATEPCGSQEGKFYQRMTKFLLLWKPWKAPGNSKPKLQLLPLLYSLPIILRHTQESYKAQEHLYQQKNSLVAEKCQQFAQTRKAELCFDAFGSADLYGRSQSCREEAAFAVSLE